MQGSIEERRERQHVDCAFESRTGLACEAHVAGHASFVVLALAHVAQSRVELAKLSNQPNPYALDSVIP